MKISELLESIEQDEDLAQEGHRWKASAKLCKSAKTNIDLGASALASCKSQGWRRRESVQPGKGKFIKDGRKWVPRRGRVVIGKSYGGTGE